MKSTIEKDFKKKGKTLQALLLENVLATFYGGKEKAAQRLKILKSSSNSDEAFLEALKEDLLYDEWMKVMGAFSETDNLSDFFKAIKGLPNDSTVNIASPKLMKMRTVVEKYDRSGKSPFLDFPLDIARKVYFTIKETRGLLGIKGNRIFKKWMKHFDLYDVSDSNFAKRKFNLLEYMKIVSTFIEKGGELNISDNIDAYIKRFEDGVMISKGQLAEITELDYRKLKEYISDLNEIPQDVHKFPYVIAQQIIAYCEAQELE